MNREGKIKKLGTWLKTCFLIGRKNKGKQPYKAAKGEVGTGSYTTFNLAAGY
jgi:hypothetical protein